MITTDFILTIETYGLIKVKARRAWVPIDTRTDKNTQNTFLPTLSTRRPRGGDATADIIYTILLTLFAFSGVKLNLRSKNTL
jgi:hypothetical protein